MILGMLLKPLGLSYKDALLLSWVGFLIFFMTRFGLDTLCAYRRTETYLKKHGLHDEHYHLIAGGGMYCFRVGYQLAVQDFKHIQALREGASH